MREDKMLKNDFATPEEIKYAESILLPPGKTFEQDKVKIIQCNESKSIKACPGSGKTTTLLAKLAILANRMPLENNQGICVLTHTNVAIDEIKSKLGHKSDILFSYPNHFGTIQSFVDKFLAIPFYRSLYGTSINEISDDYYKKNILRSYWARLNLLKAGRDADIELMNAIKHFFTANNSLLINLRLTDINGEFDLLDVKRNSLVVIKKPNPWKSKNVIDWDDTLKHKMKNWIIETIRNVWDYYGTLSFYDAYSFSNLYNNGFSQIRSFISSRFKFLFVDEMQDTDTHQLQIIENAFDHEKTIIQYFGDPHQAIFNKAKADGVWHPIKPLPINTSKRFGEDIAKILRTVCIEPNPDLTANPEINSLKPYLIIYDEPKDVLSKFSEIVSSAIVEKDGKGNTVWELSIDEKKSIKAVGWVGEPNKEDKPVNEFTIQSYFTSFRKNIKKKEKVDYDSIKTFLRKQDKATVKDYSDNIIRILVHILSTERKKLGDRNYTKSLLLSSMKENKPNLYLILTRNIAVWSKDIHISANGYNLNVIDSVKEFISKSFFHCYGINNPSKYTLAFLNDEPKEIITDIEIKANNTYQWDKNEQVKIELGTIHSVKGETHIATLLLETWYEGKHESEMIMDQILGYPYVKGRARDVYKKETLKMAYVALSRPKYLLCMAIKKERIQDILDDGNKRELLEKLWRIELV